MRRAITPAPHAAHFAAHFALRGLVRIAADRARSRIGNASNPQEKTEPRRAITKQRVSSMIQTGLYCSGSLGGIGWGSILRGGGGHVSLLSAALNRLSVNDGPDGSRCSPISSLCCFLRRLVFCFLSVRVIDPAIRPVRTIQHSTQNQTLSAFICPPKKKEKRDLKEKPTKDSSSASPGSLVRRVARRGIFADGHWLAAVQGRRANLAEQEQVEEVHPAQDEQD